MMKQARQAFAGAICMTLATLVGADASMAQTRERANLTRASAGATYYNRVGADQTAHDADTRMCMAIAASLSKNAWEPSEEPSDMAEINNSLMANAQDHSRLQGNVENCMVVKGWRVVQLSDQDAAPLASLSQADLAARLQPWIGAETPQGKVVRIFTNEAARGDTVWGAMPSYFGRNALSLKAVAPAEPPQVRHRERPPVLPRGSRTLGVPLTQANLAELPTDTALVIVKVIGTGRTNGEGFTFERLRAQGAAAAIATAPTDPVDAFYAGVKWTLMKGSAREHRESLIAIPVTPGRWRLSSKMNTLDFCLGAPAFDIKAGEVLFLGTFDIAGDALGPDMSMEPAGTFLAALPSMEERLQPASWMNGAVAACSLVYTYSLEVPGAGPISEQGLGAAPQ